MRRKVVDLKVGALHILVPIKMLVEMNNTSVENLLKMKSKLTVFLSVY